MTGTTLAAMGWILVGAVIGLTVGWIVATRALRTERQRHAEQLSEEHANSERTVMRLTADLDRAVRRTADLEQQVPGLQQEIAEQQRALDRIQAQIRDRESTISSLRSRLYGSRSSAALIEEELAARKREVVDLRERLDAARRVEDGIEDAGSDPAITVDLGDGLEIASEPLESENAKKG